MSGRAFGVPSPNITFERVHPRCKYAAKKRITGLGPQDARASQTPGHEPNHFWIAFALLRDGRFPLGNWQAGANRALLHSAWKFGRRARVLGVLGSSGPAKIRHRTDVPGWRYKFALQERPGFRHCPRG